MVIFNKFNDRGQVIIQAGLQMLNKHHAYFALPISIGWTIFKSKQCGKYYNFTLAFLCFYIALQVDVYGK